MIDISLSWLTQDVPLWAFLLAAFTAPWLWATYVKKVAVKAVSKYTTDV